MRAGLKPRQIGIHILFSHIPEILLNHCVNLYFDSFLPISLFLHSRHTKCLEAMAALQKNSLSLIRMFCLPAPSLHLSVLDCVHQHACSVCLHSYQAATYNKYPLFTNAWMYHEDISKHFVTLARKSMGKYSP